MRLRSIDFGNVFVASGALNFFGEGYPFHRLLKLLFHRGFNFTGATFVAKTTTLDPRPGNMPLRTNLQPRQIFPPCIKVDFLKAVIINAVGLSGPGAKYLLSLGKWQKREKPFFISFMAVGVKKEDRLREARDFADLLRDQLGNFQTEIGLQINISCPNTRHNPNDLAEEAIKYIQIFNFLGIPIDLKINAMMPIRTAELICATGLIDSITVSNTIPWGELPERIDWLRLFGVKESPLAKFGGGGLSGAPLLIIVGDWIRRARGAGIETPIVAGGGVLRASDVDYLLKCGADAIAIGSVAILRPWRVESIINRANEIFKRDKK